MGDECSPEEAKRRIKQWRLDGIPIDPDDEGVRKRHMGENPRGYSPAELLTDAEMEETIANYCL